MKFKSLSMTVLSCVLCFSFSLKASNDALEYTDTNDELAVTRKTSGDFAPFDLEIEVKYIKGEESFPQDNGRRYIQNGGIIVSPENAQQTKRCFVSLCNDEVPPMKKHFHERDWTISECILVPFFFAEIDFESQENPWELVNRSTPSDYVDGWSCYELRPNDGKKSHFFAVYYKEVKKKEY